jgi:hypothetical protein
MFIYNSGYFSHIKTESLSFDCRTAIAALTHILILFLLQQSGDHLGHNRKRGKEVGSAVHSLTHSLTNQAY